MQRFTEKAQETLQRAQQIMFTMQHTQLDIEHLFLALLRQRDDLPVQIIRLLGGNVGSIAQQLETALNSMGSYAGSLGRATGYITLRCNRVLQGASEQADILQSEFISVEHLFLAIAAEREGASGTILREAGIDQEKIYKVLRELAGGRGARPAPDRAAIVTRTIVNPASLPQPKGFNHGVATTGGRTLFLAGQTALDSEGKIVAPGDIVAQYRQVLGNLRAVVEEAGGTMQDIVKTTIFVSDRDGYKAHLKELGQVHIEFFGKYYPATALLEISRFFDDDALVEIEGIAVMRDA